MKILVSVALLLLTAFLFFAGFYLAMYDKGNWGYFLGAGMLSFLISAAVSAGLAAKDVEPEPYSEKQMGD